MPSNKVFQYSKIRTRKRSAKKSIKTGKKWNPALFGIRNTLCWNPEFGIHSMESRIQDCPGFPHMGRYRACWFQMKHCFMTRRELWEMIWRGRGWEVVGKDVNNIKTRVSLFCFGLYCSLLGVFLYWKQTSNKTVAKKSRKYLFANLDRYIYTLSDLGDLSHPIGSLSRTIQH